jgi:hypothetical protein
MTAATSIARSCPSSVSSTRTWNTEALLTDSPLSPAAKPVAHFLSWYNSRNER